MTTTTTIAQRIADRLDNDGTRFTTFDGTTFDELVAAESADVEWRDGWRVGDSHRYTFADGSVITVHGDAWDFGFSDCWCWAGCTSDDCHQH